MKIKLFLFLCIASFCLSSQSFAGESKYKIDDDFIEKKLNLPIFSETRVFTGYASQAWPFGKQVYFIGRIP